MADASTWKRRVAAWRASGQTATEYSAGRGFAPATLKWWSSRLSRAVTVAEPRMLRLVASPMPAPAVSRPPEMPVVLLRGEWRVEVRGGVDNTALAAVLMALDACRGGQS